MTPEEELARLRTQHSQLAHGLRLCAEHFRNKENYHLQKEEIEKARSSAIMATMCEVILNKCKE